MPLVKLQTSVKCDENKKKNIALKMSKICADCMGKPEYYVASIIDDDALISFAGEIKPAAFVEVKGIGGLTADVNKKISAEICGYLNSELNISQDRIYINFTEIAAANWGWKGSTFG